MLGLNFLKYSIDTFAARRAEIEARLKHRTKYIFAGATAEGVAAELEDRDNFKAINVFWVPEAARWEKVRSTAKRCASDRTATQEIAK